MAFDVCEVNWDLRRLAIGIMIPWCFAYDKVNHARYLTHRPLEEPYVSASNFNEGVLHDSTYMGQLKDIVYKGQEQGGLAAGSGSEVL